MIKYFSVLDLLDDNIEIFLRLTFWTEWFLGRPVLAAIFNISLIHIFLRLDLCKNCSKTSTEFRYWLFMHPCSVLTLLVG